MIDKLTEMLQKGEKKVIKTVLSDLPLKTLPITKGAYQKTHDYGHMYDLITTGRCKKPELFSEAQKEKNSNKLFGNGSWGGFGWLDPANLEFYSFLVKNKDDNIYLGDNQESNSGGYCEIRAENVGKAEVALTPRGKMVGGWSHRHPINQPSGTDTNNNYTVLTSIMGQQNLTIYEEKHLDDLVQSADREKIILQDEVTGRKYEFKLEKSPRGINKKLLVGEIVEKKPVLVGYGYSLILIGTTGRVYPEVFYCISREDDTNAHTNAKSERVELEFIDVPNDISYAYDDLVIDILKKIKLPFSVDKSKILKNIQSLGKESAERLQKK
jgi:hypothetical protein